MELHAQEKKVYTIDVFQAAFDQTECALGDTMATIYRKSLRGRDQLTVYREITGSCKNLVTLVGDSAKVALPCERIAFGYVDGNHDPKYVRNDFDLIWSRLSPGGVIAFDDYGFDLPEVTKTIDELAMQASKSIARTWKSGWKTLFIQKAAV